MNTIGKECAKQVKTDLARGKKSTKNRKLLRSCMDAIRCLHELNIYINSYKRDCDYKASVRKVCEQIKNMRTTEGLESDYGQLVFEGKMKFKRENETKFEDNCYIMCFNTRILIFEIEPNQEKNSQQLKTYQNSARNYYVYIGSIKVTKSMILGEGESSRREKAITIRTMENFSINNQESFSVMVPNEDYDKLYENFQNLIDKAAPRPSEKHKMHEFHTAVAKHDIMIKNPQPPPACGECELYIFGLLFMGYKCETCGKCYHENCFLDGMEDLDFGKL